MSGGSEATEAAWKLAREYHRARGERRWKAIARRVAYHGTTMGALSLTGCTELRTPFEPLVPDVLHVSNTNRYHRPPAETEEEFTGLLLEELEATIVQAGPDTVAMVIMEPVQNSGGAFMPPAGYFAGVRALCDEHGILLCADEVITGFGRTGHWFASERFDIKPDLITSAKGLSSAYAAIGAVIATERVMEPFTKPGSMYTHGMTFGGHPVQAAVALKNIEIMRRERIVEHVRELEPSFRATLEQLLDLPIVGDVRGCGFFYAIELVKDRETRAGFSDDGVRGAAARLRVAPAVRARPHLPRRRPRRARGADLPAAGGGAGGVRRDRRDAGRRARGGRAAHAGRGVSSANGGGAFDAVVVGAGHNGLTCAAYLARRGCGCACSSAATSSAAPA